MHLTENAFGIFFCLLSVKEAFIVYSIICLVGLQCSVIETLESCRRDRVVKVAVCAGYVKCESWKQLTSKPLMWQSMCVRACVCEKRERVRTALRV